MSRYEDRAGADHLAKIYGTEEDKVNCSFYFKIGACRHGDRCSRLHIKPLFSQTIMISNIYQGLEVIKPNATEEEKKAHFDDFYEEVFAELSKMGPVDQMRICKNAGEHLLGNLYCMYKDEDAADKAVEKLNGRLYAGRPIKCELSPVTDFNDAGCRQYVDGTCNRGDYCNFLHLRSISPELDDYLYEKYRYNPPRLRGSRDDDGPSRAGGRGGGRGGGGGDRFRGGNNNFGGRGFGEDRYGGGGGGDRYGGGAGGSSRDRERDRSPQRRGRSPSPPHHSQPPGMMGGPTGQQPYYGAPMAMGGGYDHPGPGSGMSGGGGPPPMMAPPPPHGPMGAPSYNPAAYSAYRELPKVSSPPRPPVQSSGFVDPNATVPEATSLLFALAGNTFSRHGAPPI